MVKADYEEARKSWLCTGCAFPKPNVKKVDVTIQDSEPDNTPLNFISGCGVGIGRRDFLNSLGEKAIQNDLYIGQVRGPDGNLLKDWVTFIGRQRVIVRGSTNVSYRRCSDCGRHVYFAMGEHYLYPRPPEGYAIFDSGNGGLVVTEELATRAVLSRWKKLTHVKVPVLDAPKDGLLDF